MKYVINGFFFNIIKSTNVCIVTRKARWEVNGQSSHYLSLQTGLLQGEALSQVLFSLLINGLEKEMLTSGSESL